jgi:Polyketide cyclase / dehydrase and lipid transport
VLRSLVQRKLRIVHYGGRMPDRTTSSTTIGAGRADVMAVIADFPGYPEWAGQVKSAQVLDTGPDGRPRTVRFVLDAGPISDTYTLGYTWHGDDGVSWRVVEPGKMVSDLQGSYRLADAGSGTEVTYELAVDLSVPMLGLIRRKAEKVIVDTALRGLKKRVEGRLS